MGVAGLVLGICGIVSVFIGIGFPVFALIGLPLSITGLVLSIVAGKREKSGITTAGLVVGIIATVLTAITFLTCGVCVLCVADAYYELF